MKKKAKGHKKNLEPEVDMLDDSKNKYFAFANTILTIMTLISIAAIALETVASLQIYHLIFKAIEWVAVVLFSAEYITRLFTNKKPIRYIFSFFGIIDLIAVAPSILGLTNLTFLKSARTIRIIRLLRMVRMAKVARAKDRDKAAKSVYKINLQIYLIALVLVVLALGCLFYIFEHGVKDGRDIPSGMYWALRVILSGIPYPQPQTLGGTITLILARFTSLIMLGLMVNVIGTMLRKILTGADKREG